jgi:hypothetical protein
MNLDTSHPQQRRVTSHSVWNSRAWNGDSDYLMDIGVPFNRFGDI